MGSSHVKLAYGGTKKDACRLVYELQLGDQENPGILRDLYQGLERIRRRDRFLGEVRQL